MKNLNTDPIKLQIIPVISTICFLYLAYCLLLINNPCNTSIAAIIATSHQYTAGNHVIILSLLPIYIAFMVFGAMGLGIYLGQKIKAYLNRA